MKKYKSGISLSLIVLLALFLRVYKVDQIPPALSWDEVSIGYNAYSILKTGRDEHGKFLPLDAFVAYGDYKPPLAIYLTVPSVAIFGLNEFGVRFPSVFFGTLTVLVFYFLVKELSANSAKLITNSNIAAIASLLLAISPWHINLSRAGWEANIATFFVTLGAAMILISRRHPKLLWVAALPLVAAVYTFNSSRYFAPLLGLLLLWFSGHKIWKEKKNLFIGAVIAAFVLLPILGHLISPAARLRFTEVNIFTDASVVEQTNKRIEMDGSPWWGTIVHNRRWGYLQSYLVHFLDHFEPWYLFIRGDGNPKFSTQDVGQLYILELPLLIFGLYWLYVNDRRLLIFLVLWILAAIAPAAVARETPHALRTENSLPALMALNAIGLYASLEISNKFRRQAVLLLMIILYLGNFTYYLHGYYTHYPREYSGEWQYGYRQTISFVNSIKDNYDLIEITDSIGRPYMYTLFYTQLDPREYLLISKDEFFDAAGFYHNRGFAKYRFTATPGMYPSSRTLYVTQPGLVPATARVLKTINLLNGQPILVVYET